MARFHTLEVADITTETPESISIGFRIPPELRADFSFIHGQYLTLKLNFNGTELRRSYSICSSPLDKDEVRIAVKKVEGGRASTQLVEQLKPGSKLEVMTPMGNFHTELDPAQEHHYIAFAAGSGITPILSILTTVLRTEHKSRFTLFFGNSDVDRIIFRQKLDELKKVHPERLNVYHILSRGTDADALFNGRITHEKAVKLLKTFVNDPLHKEYFICGPEQMMVNVSEALERSGVEKRHIHIELFSSPVTSEPKKTAPAAERASGEPLKGKARVKVVLDGNETEIEVDPKGDSILDSAEAAGLDVPYACKGAVCCTCKARIVEGKVAMDMNYALTDEEVADGYVLTCQSHPLTERVVVDYDQH
jgi:ring-1,2-phenylacetyl-CoA epoxidase subunit PaaE